jgi:hypothetical protein
MGAPTASLPWLLADSMLAKPVTSAHDGAEIRLKQTAKKSFLIKRAPGKIAVVILFPVDYYDAIVLKKD